MLARNKKFSHIARVLMLGAPLFLAACHSDWGPHPMPSGYTHHDKLIKAPPGPEPVLKKIEHGHIPPANDGKCSPCTSMPQATADTGMLVVASAPGVYSDAAHDLITRLAAEFGQPAEPVWLRPAAGSPADMNLEGALRAAMAEKGFPMASGPGQGPFTLDYAARPLEVGDGNRMMVTITLATVAGAAQEVSGIYTLGDGVAAAPAPVVTGETIVEPVSSGEPMPIGPLN